MSPSEQPSADAPDTFDAGMSLAMGGAAGQATAAQMVAPLDVPGSQRIAGYAGQSGMPPTAPLDQPMPDHPPINLDYGTRSIYSRALMDGSTTGPQHFSEALAGASWNAVHELNPPTGSDTNDQRSAAATGAARGVAANLPTREDLTDFGVALTHDAHGVADPLAVNITQQNLMDYWAKTGVMPAQAFQQAQTNPDLKRMLTTPQPGQQPPDNDVVGMVDRAHGGYGMLGALASGALGIARFWKGSTDQIAAPWTGKEPAPVPYSPEDFGRVAADVAPPFPAMISNIIQGALSGSYAAPQTLQQQNEFAQQVSMVMGGADLPGILHGLREPPVGVALQSIGGNTAAALGKRVLDKVEVQGHEGPGIDAWHASPYNFKQFDESHIGKGEGAGEPGQGIVRGKGLYFGGAEDTGVNYQHELGGAPRETATGRQLDLTGNTRDIATHTLMEHDGNVDAAADSIMSRTNEPEGSPLHLSDDQATEVLQRLKAHQEGTAPLPEVTNGTANLYKVRLHVDQEHLLDQDTPLRMQSPFVKAAVEKLGITPEELAGGGKEPRGEDLYHALVAKAEKAGARDPHQAASEALEKVGLPGMRYLDAGSRQLHEVTGEEGTRPQKFVTRPEAEEYAAQNPGSTIKSPTGNTHNYVVFRGKNTSITHVNGEPLNQRQPSMLAKLAVDERGGNGPGQFTPPERQEALAQAHAVDHAARRIMDHMFGATTGPGVLTRGVEMFFGDTKMFKSYQERQAQVAHAKGVLDPIFGKRKRAAAVLTQQIAKGVPIFDKDEAAFNEYIELRQGDIKAVQAAKDEWVKAGGDPKRFSAEDPTGGQVPPREKPMTMKFLDYVQGRSQGRVLRSELPPEAQDLADMFRSWNERQRAGLEAMQAEKGGDIGPEGWSGVKFVEDYFHPMWKDTEQSRRIFGGGLQGSLQGALKQKIHPTVSDGIDAGLKPAMNVLRMFVNHTLSVEHYLNVEAAFAGERALGREKGSTGGIKYGLQNAPPPMPGWKQLRGRSTVIAVDHGEKPAVMYAYAPPGFADLWNRKFNAPFFSAGRAGPTAAMIARDFTKVSNAINVTFLGTSLYHARTLLTAAVDSALSFGAKDFIAGKWDSTGRALMFPIDIMMPDSGARALQGHYDMSITPGMPGYSPARARIADLLTEVGGEIATGTRDIQYRMASGAHVSFFRAIQDAVPRRQLTEHWGSIFHDENGVLSLRPSNVYAGVMEGIHTVAQELEAASAPMFEQWVPTMKASGLDHAGMDAIERNPAISDDELRNVLRSEVKRGENAFGMLNQDTLHWNNTLKQVLNAISVSFTWGYKFWRGAGMGVNDIINGHVLGPNARYMLTYPVALALMTSVHAYMMGQKPDWWAFAGMSPTGGKTVNHSPEYSEEPGEQKEVLGLMHAILTGSILDYPEGKLNELTQIIMAGGSGLMHAVSQGPAKAFAQMEKDIMGIGPQWLHPNDMETQGSAFKSRWDFVGGDRPLPKWLGDWNKFWADTENRIKADLWVQQKGASKHNATLQPQARDPSIHDPGRPPWYHPQHTGATHLRYKKQ